MQLIWPISRPIFLAGLLANPAGQAKRFITRDNSVVPYAKLPEETSEAIADLSAASARLGAGLLHPRTASNLADLVRLMNTYYSNLIEGHNTRPRDIAAAIEGKFEADNERRNLQLEARAHVRVQAEIDRMAAEGTLPEPASVEFIQWIHREFYRDAPDAMLLIKDKDTEFRMTPGAWRSKPEEDVAVGRHLPPSSDRVADFMAYFAERYRLDRLKTAGRILAIPAAHHRFPDGNGRVSRLTSHAMAQQAGIGAHGLWSISRGLARGLERPSEYKTMMDLADTPRHGDRDGRGNLSEKALAEFTLWFLKVCLDQAMFMNGLFEIDRLGQRLASYVARHENLKPEAARLLDEALVRGEFQRGDVARITGMPDRSARRVLADVLDAGLLGSDTPKGAVSLRYPLDALDLLFPRLFPET